MRLVIAPPFASALATLPGPEQIAVARDLGAHFPEAHLRPTSVVRAESLDARADASGGTRIWLALESLQVTGSFKVRGALMVLARLRGRGVRAVTASAGNHGAGVAYASGVLGVPAVVVVPAVAPRTKREKISAYGASIVVSPSPHYDDAEALAQEIAEKEGGVFVSAYDDLDVVAGNGVSVGCEIVRGLGRVPDALFAPVGGGALATGLSLALATEAGETLPAVRRVWGVQSEASPGMARSLERGAAIERLTEGAPTLAEGLEGGVAQAAFERARTALAGVCVVSEHDIGRAIAFAKEVLGFIVEGSAAVALVPVLRGLPEPARGGDVVVLLSGRNVDEERLERCVQRYSAAAALLEARE